MKKAYIEPVVEILLAESTVMIAESGETTPPPPSADGTGNKNDVVDAKGTSLWDNEW